MPLFLRAPRAAGLWLIGIVIPVATVAGFVLSYIGLYDWALHHQWPWYLAPMFPLLIDLLIVAAEVVLFVAAIDGNTPRRVRVLAWVMVIVFTGLSVVGNVGHAGTSDLLTRGGWGLPPLVLAVALGFGLGELKRQAAKYREDVAGESLQQGASQGSPATSPQFPPPEFTDKVGAAEVAYRRSVSGGNPFKAYALATRFEIPRPVASEIVERVNGNGAAHG